MTLAIILVVFAFVFFSIAALWNPTPSEPYRGRLIAAGLACYMASILFGTFKL